MWGALGACPSIVRQCDAALLVDLFHCIGDYLPVHASPPLVPGRLRVDPLRRWPLRVRVRVRRSARLNALL